ncbi:MAG TPA: glycosyltransferase family 2 protein [Acidobacteriota bacterium]|nr:glycosyltransferase family 2 protein [Acidobacteriota bacterium]
MKLSVCLTYYSGLEYLRGCLESIRDNAPPCEHEIVVIDDASPDPCAETVAEVSPGAVVIRNPENLGFAGANNVAWQASRGEYVLFLNTDTKVLPGALDELVAYLEEHAEVGAVGPMVLNEDGSFQPQCRRGRLTPLSGLTYSLRLDRLYPDNRTVSEYLMRYTDREQVQPVRGLSGCCMLFRRAVLETGGGFDETLHQYGEDLDLCYRAGNAGWQVIYDAGARIIHYGGQGGTNLRVVRSLYYFHRSLWVIFLRYNTNRAFHLYSWFVILMLAARFGLSSSMLLLGQRRAGTRKGAQRFRREQEPAVKPPAVTKAE